VPEIIEAELYRSAAEAAVGRPVVELHMPDDRAVRGERDAQQARRELSAALIGSSFVAAGRHGKVVLLHTERGGCLGMRFGMTGRLLVDGKAPIEQLLYAGHGDRHAWHRFTVVFDDGGSLVLSDQRRLGGVTLDPDLSALGPDAWTPTTADLEAVAAGSVAVKTRLLDQTRLAGLGNLLTDEILWRVGISPLRRSCELSTVELESLAATVGRTVDELHTRGGSHTGDLQAVRHSEHPECPTDGEPLSRRAVGGRTTVWCPAHQR